MFNLGNIYHLRNVICEISHLAKGRISLIIHYCLSLVKRKASEAKQNIFKMKRTVLFSERENTTTDIYRDTRGKGARPEQLKDVFRAVQTKRVTS